MKQGSLNLSIEMLVVIILSLIILSAGIILTKNLLGQASSINQLSLDEIDRQIGSLACESNKQVCIPVRSADLQKGEFKVFGINIKNLEISAQDFRIIIFP